MADRAVLRLSFGRNHLLPVVDLSVLLLEWMMKTRKMNLEKTDIHSPVLALSLVLHGLLGKNGIEHDYLKNGSFMEIQWIACGRIMTLKDCST